MKVNPESDRFWINLHRTLAATISFCKTQALRSPGCTERDRGTGNRRPKASSKPRPPAREDWNPLGGLKPASPNRIPALKGKPDARRERILPKGSVLDQDLKVQIRPGSFGPDSFVPFHPVYLPWVLEVPFRARANRRFAL